VERKLGEQVTLISADNESITILMDTQTHLPLERIFQWRDPLYKTRTRTPRNTTTTTRWRIPDAVFDYPLQERRDVEAVLHQEGDLQSDAVGDFWSVDAADRRIKK